MKKQLYIQASIEINAKIEQVWDWLVNPKKTPLYMYNCSIKSKFKIGDPVHWIGLQDEKMYVKGEIIAFSPHKIFSFTVFDPHGKYEDKKENYLTVEYVLTPSEEEGCVLKVKQGDYSQVEQGEKRYNKNEDEGDWKSILEKIKELIEIENHT